MIYSSNLWTKLNYFLLPANTHFPGFFIFLDRVFLHKNLDALFSCGLILDSLTFYR